MISFMVKFLSLLFAQAKNTIPMINKGIEMSTAIHNHRLIKFLTILAPTEITPAVPNVRKSKLTKNQSTPTITGDSTNHNHTFLFIFSYK